MDIIAYEPEKVLVDPPNAPNGYLHGLRSAFLQFPRAACIGCMAYISRTLLGKDVRDAANAAIPADARHCTVPSCIGWIMS